MMTLTDAIGLSLPVASKSETEQDIRSVVSPQPDTVDVQAVSERGGPTPPPIPPQAFHRFLASVLVITWLWD